MLLEWIKEGRIKTFFKVSKKVEDTWKGTD
jgi:hypothetical protein